MMKAGYEQVDTLSGGTLSIPKKTGKQYDEIAQKIFRSDCPYFAAPVNEVTINGETIFRYDLGNFKSIDSINMKMSGSEFIRLLRNLITPLTDCCDWLLDSHNFIPSSDLVFVSGYDYNVRYIYSFDEADKTDDKEISEFFTELIKKVRITDSTDLTNVLLRMVVDNNVSVASLLDMVRRYEEEQKNGRAEVRQEIRPQARQTPPPIPETPVKITKKEQAKPEIRFPKIPAPIVPKPEPELEKPPIPEIRAASEMDETMEKLFGGSTGKRKEQKKNRKEKKPSQNGKSMEILRSLLKKEKPQSENGAAVGQQSVTDVSGSDETVFGGDDATELGAAVPCFVLREKKGELDAPHKIDISLDLNGEMYIGRQCENSEHEGFKFPSEFKKVSRSHAKVTYDGTAYYLTDLASSNKTAVNGINLVPDTPCRLTDGATVRFGDELYLYEFKEY